MKIYTRQKRALYINLFALVLSPLSSLAASTANDARLAIPPTEIVGKLSAGRASKTFINEDEKFDRIFREGRDLVAKEEWKLATAKFNEIACDCPENKKVDAAFYWLAYCYKKQKMFEKAGETIDRLEKNFPNSSWLADARVLSYELYPPRPARATSPRDTVRTTSTSGYPDLVNLRDPARATRPAFPIDREDEIKLAAFKSLLVADPGRAIEVLGDMLKPDSKTSEILKGQFLRTKIAPGSPFIANLRDTLIKSYQNEKGTEIKAEMIYALSGLDEDDSLDYIVRQYSAGADREIKKTIIGALGYNPIFSAFARLTVATTSSNTHATIADTSKTAARRKIRFEKLRDIVEVEADVELRRLALSSLLDSTDSASKEGLVEMLANLYDTVADEEIKLIVLRSFSRIKKDQATAKLMSIAKNDNSDKMRIEAIDALRTSKNPAVLKFLEDLIK